MKCQTIRRLNDGNDMTSIFKMHTYVCMKCIAGSDWDWNWINVIKLFSPVNGNINTKCKQTEEYRGAVGEIVAASSQINQIID